MKTVADSPGLTHEEAMLVKALFRVERAARRVTRYPTDMEPRRSLSRALQAVDKARKDLG